MGGVDSTFAIFVIIDSKGDVEMDTSLRTDRKFITPKRGCQGVFLHQAEKGLNFSGQVRIIFIGDSFWIEVFRP